MLTLRSLFRFSTKVQPKADHYTYAKDIPANVAREHMNLFQAINSGIDIALATDQTYIFIDLELRFSERMLNLVVFLDVLMD